MSKSRTVERESLKREYKLFKKRWIEQRRELQSRLSSDRPLTPAEQQTLELSKRHVLPFSKWAEVVKSSRAKESERQEKMPVLSADDGGTGDDWEDPRET